MLGCARYKGVDYEVYFIFLKGVFALLVTMQVMGQDNVKENTISPPSVHSESNISGYYRRQIKREEREALEPSCRLLSEYKYDCTRGLYGYGYGLLSSLFTPRNPGSCYEFANWMEKFLGDPAANSQCAIFLVNKRPLVMFDTFSERKEILVPIVDNFVESLVDGLEWYRRNYVVRLYERGCRFNDGRACRRLGEMEEEIGNLDAARLFYERMHNNEGTFNSPYIIEHNADTTLQNNNNRFVYSRSVGKNSSFFLIKGLNVGTTYSLHLADFSTDLDLYIYNGEKRLNQSTRYNLESEEVSFPALDDKLKIQVKNHDATQGSSFVLILEEKEFPETSIENPFENPFPLDVEAFFEKNPGEVFVYSEKVGGESIYFLIKGLTRGRSYKLRLFDFTEDIDLYLYDEREYLWMDSTRGGSREENILFTSPIDKVKIKLKVWWDISETSFFLTVEEI